PEQLLSRQPCSATPAPLRGAAGGHSRGGGGWSQRMVHRRKAGGTRRWGEGTGRVGPRGEGSRRMEARLAAAIQASAHRGDEETFEAPGRGSLDIPDEPRVVRLLLF